MTEYTQWVLSTSLDPIIKGWFHEWADPSWPSEEYNKYPQAWPGGHHIYHYHAYGDVDDDAYDNVGDDDVDDDADVDEECNKYPQAWQGSAESIMVIINIIVIMMTIMSMIIMITMTLFHQSSS